MSEHEQPSSAKQIDGHGQWLSIREDQLLPIVESFFAERVFGPMRLDKLARQLRAHEQTSAKPTLAIRRDLRDTIADVDRRIALQIGALEDGIEPDLVKQRIAELRKGKEKAEIELRALAPAEADQRTAEDAEGTLRRIPDLTQLLRTAPPELKRQVFDAFGLQIAFDKTANKIWLNASITDQLATTLELADDLVLAPNGLAAPNQEVVRVMSVTRPKPRLASTRKPTAQLQDAP